MKYQHIERWQQDILLKALKTRRVLSLEGARQCGKTTLAKSLSCKNVIFRTLDDYTFYQAAKYDSKDFIKHGDELMIIDEIQRVPELLHAIKEDVDNNQKPGRFLLTGSANIQALPGVRESLAGRMRKVCLHSLSQGEIAGKKPYFIKYAFANNWSSFNYDTLSKGDYLKKAMVGGYPEALRIEEVKETQRWHYDYVQALLERDLKDIVNIRRKDSMKKLLEVLAAWSSKFIDLSRIGTNLSVSRPTLETYINALQTLYIIGRVRPWPRSDYDRVSKQDKLFMEDSGLMASILQWQLEEVRLDGDKSGKLIETFVYNQLISLIDLDNDYNLFHYRDRDKREIDFIIENKQKETIALEVKASSSVGMNDFKHIKWFQERESREKKCVGIVLYTGQEIVSFGSQLWAIPLQYLWNVGPTTQRYKSGHRN